MVTTTGRIGGTADHKLQGRWDHISGIFARRAAIGSAPRACRVGRSDFERFGEWGTLRDGGSFQSLRARFDTQQSLSFFEGVVKGLRGLRGLMRIIGAAEAQRRNLSQTISSTRVLARTPTSFSYLSLGRCCQDFYGPLARGLLPQQLPRKSPDNKNSLRTICRPVRVAL